MKIGILGAGQLGRMLVLAGYELGLQFLLYDEKPDCCAGQVAPLLVGSYTDKQALKKFLDQVDLVTFEFENVPPETLRFCQEQRPTFPGVLALETTQDRIKEKTLLRSLAIPTADFYPVNSSTDLTLALEKLGYPAVLKTTRLGYDGKGQAVILNKLEADTAWNNLGSQALVLESFVNFERELSIIGVRSTTGEQAFYPLVQNQHRSGILHLTQAPAPNLTPELQTLAEKYLSSIFKALDYVGVLALELFQQGKTLLANEIAPRVHNSGHWSIEGAYCSQFSNHLRSIMGLPLGQTAARSPCAMLNLIGKLPKAELFLKQKQTNLHLYGKEARSGRKLGHVTVLAKDQAELETLIVQTSQIVDMP